MAHLWRDDRQCGVWQLHPLPSDGCPLGEHVSIVPARRGLGLGEHWVVVAQPSARIALNGEPLRVGLRLLADRDEIVMREPAADLVSRCFFSKEQLAQVEPLPATSGPLACPRCKQPIQPGDAAVRCPGCGVWHHAGDALPCWTYDATCAASCGQATPSDTGFSWTPGEL